MARLKYPHQNHNLKNLKGERWKDVPGLEGYCQLSNMGRVKRLEYEMQYSNGRMYTKPEMIIKPIITTQQSKANSDNKKFISSRIAIDGIRHNLTLARLMYFLFVKKFNLNDQQTIILCKDGDGLNIHPGNLIKATSAERSQRTFARGRGFTPFGDPTAPWVSQQRAAIVQKISKQVSQYNSKGKRMKTFKSCAEAEKRTTIHAQSIGFAAANPGRRAGGYYWSWGTPESLDIMTAKKERTNKHRAAYCQKVTQYDNTGKKLAVYPSVPDAHEATDCQATAIRMAIKGMYKSVKGFIWKAGDGPERINLDGYLWGRASMAKTQSKPVGQYSLKGKLLTTYSSLKAAAQALHMNSSTISAACRGQQLTAGGFKWKYTRKK